MANLVGCVGLPVSLSGFILGLMLLSVEHSITSGSFFQTQVSPLYFDRKDVKEAIHASIDVDWTLCTDTNVFPNGDASLPSAFTVLPNVIEKSKRSVIVHGLADFRLIAEGARIVLQK